MNSPNNTFTRRRFLRTAALGAASGAQLAWSADEKSAISQGGTYFNEPSSRLPIVNDADVIVCGAGPAGISAAITAARTGARTRLFEVHGCLGGVWTAGLLTYIFDFDKPGLTRELVKKLDERDARRNRNPSRFTYEPEAMKLLIEEMCVAAGVKVQLHTRVAAAYRQGNGLPRLSRNPNQAAKRGRLQCLLRQRVMAISARRPVVHGKPARRRNVRASP